MTYKTIPLLELRLRLLIAYSRTGLIVEVHFITKSHMYHTYSF